MRSLVFQLKGIFRQSSRFHWSNRRRLRPADGRVLLGKEKKRAMPYVDAAGAKLYFEEHGDGYRTYDYEIVSSGVFSDRVLNDQSSRVIHIGSTTSVSLPVYQARSTIPEPVGLCICAVSRHEYP